MKNISDVIFVALFLSLNKFYLLYLEHLKVFRKISIIDVWQSPKYLCCSILFIVEFKHVFLQGPGKWEMNGIVAVGKPTMKYSLNVQVNVGFCDIY